MLNQEAPFPMIPYRISIRFRGQKDAAGKFTADGRTMTEDLFVPRSVEDPLLYALREGLLPYSPDMPKNQSFGFTEVRMSREPDNPVVEIEFKTWTPETPGGVQSDVIAYRPLNQPRQPVVVKVVGCVPPNPEGVFQPVVEWVVEDLGCVRLKRFEVKVSHDFSSLGPEPVLVWETNLEAAIHAVYQATVRSLVVAEEGAIKAGAIGIGGEER